MRCCVIIPTYENLSTLPAILDDCDAANLPVIVVDDGSTDGTAEAIRTWLDQGENRWSITMKVNGGKGAALAAGLAEAVLGEDPRRRRRWPGRGEDVGHCST